MYRRRWLVFIALCLIQKWDSRVTTYLAFHELCTFVQYCQLFILRKTTATITTTIRATTTTTKAIHGVLLHRFVMEYKQNWASFLTQSQILLNLVLSLSQTLTFKTLFPFPKMRLSLRAGAAPRLWHLNGLSIAFLPFS